jgi:ATP-binding protein involved in chromosome partitioning
LFGKRKTICVTSNKGGVGKTVVSIGIARALASRHKTMLLDLDVHGPDVLVRLGLMPDLADFTQPLIEPISYQPNLWAFSADCLSEDQRDGYLAKDEDKRAFVRSALNTLNFHGAKYVVCDMPAGTDEILFHMLKEDKPQHIILVTNPEKASLLDTEKLVNILVHYGMQRKILGVIENMAYVQGPDGLVGHRFNNASAKHWLCPRYDLEYLGGIPEYVDWDGNGKSTEQLLAHDVFRKIAEMV